MDKGEYFYGFFSGFVALLVILGIWASLAEPGMHQETKDNCAKIANALQARDWHVDSGMDGSCYITQNNQLLHFNVN